MMIKFLRLFFQLILLLLVFAKAMAQSEATSHAQSFSAKSPEAYAFTKIGNTPMNPFTGQLQVSLPLYEKKLLALGLNLSLDYTTPDGIKAGAQGTIVGQSWLLKFGGIISRNKRGVPDDFKNAYKVNGISIWTRYNGILYGDGLSNKPDGEGRVSSDDPVFQYGEGLGDSQHDIFEFNILGKSGKFYIGKDKSVLIVTDSKMKIIPNFTNSTLPEFELGTFLVIDEYGVKYYFDKVERAKTEGYPPSNTYIGASTYFSKEYASSWMLTRIESPFNEEYIQFDYVERPYGGGGDIGGSVLTKRTDLPYWNTSYGGSSIIRKQDIKQITFSDGTNIKFEYFKNEPGSNDEYPLLKEVHTVNNVGTTVKKYAFIYSWWVGPEDQRFSNTHVERYSNYGGNLRTHLHTVQEISETGVARVVYAMDYFLAPGYNETTVALPGTDYWGYRNGKGEGFQTPTSTPGNRDPDLQYAKLGALRKIIYGTGGSETYDYQLNTRQSPSGDVVIGGLRLLKRTLHDGISTANDIIKEYRYIETDGRSSGFLGDTPALVRSYPVYHDNGGWPSNPSVKYSVWLYFAYSSNPLSTVEGGFVGYRRVEELLQNGTKSNGKIVYEYSDLSYTNLWYPLDYFPYRPVDRPFWAVGLPLKTSYYAANATVPTKEIVSTYSISQQSISDENYRSLHTEKVGEIDVSGGGSLLRYIYKYKNYYPIIGRSELESTTETTHPNNVSTTSVVKQTVNTYDPNHYFIRSTSQTNSKGQTFEKRFYYPVDYNLGAGSFPVKLIEKNILNQSIYEQTWLKEPSSTDMYLMQSEASEYQTFVNNMVKPSVLYRSRLAKPVLSTPGSFDATKLLQTADNLKPEVYFNAYDASGRLTEYQNAGAKKVAVAFDKGGNLLAKAENSSLQFFGFEGNESSAWTFTPSNISSSEALNGSNSYKGVITINNTDPDITSVQFYIKGSGTVSAGSYNLTATGTWTRQTIPIGIASLVINTNNAFIDDIALVNGNAQVTFYTHKSEVGILKETDANSTSIYYEYDAFNRLKTVKDHLGNITKNLQYVYKSPFSSAAQSGSFVKSCPAGPPEQVPGPPVTYPVAAGKYASAVSQADADAMALSDVKFNGQQYANDHGTCLTVYYNVAVSQPFTKNDCPPNTLPTQHYYLVEANKYSSTISQADADAKAMAEINANGQNNANTIGSCAVLINVSVYNDTPDKIEVSFGGLGQSFICQRGQTTLQIPSGTYTVHIQPFATGPFNFGLGARSTVNGSSATFYDVNVSTENYMSAW